MRDYDSSEKASLFLDDDDELSILDGADDEDEEDNRYKPAPKSHAVPSSQSVKSTDKHNVEKKDGSSRIQYYRALQSFLQALSEAAPLYLGERQRHPGLSEAQMGQKIGSMCKSHLDLIDKIMALNKADPQDILLRYQRRTLAKQVAALYPISSLPEIEAMIDAAHLWSDEHIEYEPSGNKQISTDNLLAVKLVLFSSGLKAQQDLDGLWCSHRPSEVIGNLQRIAVDMAKEMTHNWSQRSQVSDLESLFTTLLPHCLDMASMAYKEVVSNELPEIEYLVGDPALALDRVNESIEEMNMGYEGEDRDALLTRLRLIVQSHIEKAQRPLLDPLMTSRWRSSWVEAIDAILAESWTDASNVFMEMISDMEPDARERYVQEHSRMDLDDFMQRVKESLDSLEIPMAFVEVDFELVGLRARRHLVWLWGISDSLMAVGQDSTLEE